MSRGERQKPVTQKYRDNYDSIFSPLPIPVSKSQAKRLRVQEAIADQRPEWEKDNAERDFCAHCGAGIGDARRDGEGTCPSCTTERDRVVGEGGNGPFTVGTSGDKG